MVFPLLASVLSLLMAMLMFRTGLFGLAVVIAMELLPSSIPRLNMVELLVLRLRSSDALAMVLQLLGTIGQDMATLLGVMDVDYALLELARMDVGFPELMMLISMFATGVLLALAIALDILVAVGPSCILSLSYMWARLLLTMTELIALLRHLLVVVVSAYALLEGVPMLNELLELAALDIDEELLDSAIAVLVMGALLAECMALDIRCSVVSVPLMASPVVPWLVTRLLHYARQLLRCPRHLVGAQARLMERVALLPPEQTALLLAKLRISQLAPPEELLVKLAVAQRSRTTVRQRLMLMGRVTLLVPRLLQLVPLLAH